MNDFEVVNRIEKIIGRKISVNFDNGVCNKLSLGNENYPFYGLARHLSDKDKAKVLNLVSLLSGLERLDLRQNLLGSLPNGFSELKKLKYLDLASNNLGEIPELVFLLEDLEFLNLGVNQLSYISDNIGSLRKLEKLYLHKNKIEYLPLSITELSDLKVLNLYLNRFKVFPLVVFDLDCISTFAWGVSDLECIPDQIERWKDLEYVSFVANKIENIEPLFNNCNLLGVRVHKNRISNISGRICNLEKMRQISLYQNELSILPEGFSTLYNVEMINLAQNNFKNIPSCLSKLEKLSWLSMHDNEININELPCFVGNIKKMILERPFTNDSVPTWNKLDYM